MFHAVHIGTETGDHYTYLIEANTPKQMIRILKTNQDFAYFTEVEIASEDDEVQDRYIAAVNEAVADAFDKENP